MTIEQFNVLYQIQKQGKNFKTENVIVKTEYMAEKIHEIIDGLLKCGWINDAGITEQGQKELNRYKVDNAIIMAAGFGLRSLPLSRYVPKGLFKVKGEVLVERQIEQLKEAGVEEIIVVVGYLKEKFLYLREKYGAIIVENNDYYRYNNMSSLYAAKDYLKNSFVCCSDNYFTENVFENYVYDSYYSCKYTEQYADEHCVMRTDGDYIAEIIKGGEKAWYTIGEAYFSKEFSSKFCEYMEQEYHTKDAKKLIWDDFHIRHINELKLRLVKYTDEIVQEFDTIDDIKKFDPEFGIYETAVLQEAERQHEAMPNSLSKYEDIERYNSATTDEHVGRLHLNENTFGPSRQCLDILKEITIQDLYEYDMATSDFLIEAISSAFAMPADDIFIHNGSAEIIKSVFSIALEKGDCILTSYPGWSYYGSIAKGKFCNVYYYNVLKDDYTYYVDVKDILEKAKKYRPKIIVLTSPHNPTGCKMDENAIETIIRQNPDSLILLDEAYWGFAEEDIDTRRLVEAYTNIIVSRTFSKYYGLANVRIGFGFCNSKVKHIYGLDLPLFRESSISRKMALVALKDKKYYESMNNELNVTKLWFIDELNKIEGIRAFASYSNFVAVKAEQIDLHELQMGLKNLGIRIRLFIDGDECLARITIAQKDVMERLIAFIKQSAERKGE